MTGNSFATQINVRYRGYYYDSETGLYYLQSRYYDPETGRFLNADDVNFLGATETLLSYNAFAYCENDPVNKVDFNGKTDVSVLTFKKLRAIMFFGLSVVIALEAATLSMGTSSSNVILLIATGVISVTAISAIIIQLSRDIEFYDNLIFINNASTAATPPPPNKGGKGTQVTSKTLYNNKKKGYRIDVENPGNRQGQIHLQKNGIKYVYNVKDKAFHIGKSTGKLAPKAIQELLNEKAVVKAIVKGLKILGY